MNKVRVKISWKYEIGNNELFILINILHDTEVYSRKDETKKE